MGLICTVGNAFFVAHWNQSSSGSAFSLCSRTLSSSLATRYSLLAALSLSLSLLCSRGLSFCFYLFVLLYSSTLLLFSSSFFFLLSSFSILLFNLVIADIDCLPIDLFLQCRLVRGRFSTIDVSDCVWSTVSKITDDRYTLALTDDTSVSVGFLM